VTYRIAKLLTYLAFVSTYVCAQQVVEGRVVDRETGKPIPFASIGIVGTAKGTSTNLEGYFSLVMETKGAVKISCVGYESVQLTSLEFIEEIQLTPKAIQLKDVVVFSKEVNPERMVRKALTGVVKNFASRSFFQTYFYRHYCQDDGRYGRLIEAFVDVWRKNGYREDRSSAGQREELRVSQLRRSLDRTAVSQSHEPMAVESILQADMAAYQMPKDSGPLDFHAGLSNLASEIDNYTFTFSGITSYDDEEVFEVKYEYPNENFQTPPGYRLPPKITGTLYITTKDHAIVRSEELRARKNDTIRTSAFYRKYNDKYFPSHLIRDGGNYLEGKKIHWFHVELVSVEISEDPARHFEGAMPGKNELLAIGYDPEYWKQHSILTATPLEQQIIRDLGGGKSLEQQFELYQQYELNTNNGGVDGETKLQWLIEFSKNQKPLVLCYWLGDYIKNAVDLEKFKQLNKKYRGQATFAMVSLDNDQPRWAEDVQKHGLAFDGLIQYRLENSNMPIDKLPFFRLSTREGILTTVPVGNTLAEEIERALREF
jgi:hypothetical protein